MTYPRAASWGVRGDLASNNALKLLNGTVVGLCHVDPDAHARNDDAMMGAPVLYCVGLGIVRSMD
jgi:hypothetical protein